MNRMIQLLYQYSRVLNTGINRKRFEIKSSHDRLWAINTSKNTFIALLVTLFSCGLLFTGLIEIYVNKAEPTLAFVLIFFFIHVLIGLIGLRQFLWLLNGKQELIIEHNFLVLKESGTFFNRRKKYSLNNVKNIRFGIDDSHMSFIDKIKFNISLNRKVVFSHIVGQILFDYYDKTIRIFNDLNEEERSEFLIEIKKMVEK